jgi:tRNA A-37 threonylcarbamoyl transferase component Bud32/membrane-associated phospholipid phosphatase
VALIDEREDHFVVTEEPPKKRRRRPSGEPPPLPRHLYSGKYWLGLTMVAILGWAIIVFVDNAWVETTRFDVAILETIEGWRTAWMTRVMETLHSVGSEWVTRVLRIGVILALLFLKRFRHLFVFFFSILAVGLVTTVAATEIGRPRPLLIEIIGHWQGAAHPSRPIAAVAATLLAILYTLIVPGRARKIGKWLAGSLLLALSIARIYLGVDHPTDVIVAIILGVSIPLVAYRMFTPNDVFPVSYKKHRAAHLDVDGPRGDAIVAALEEQLGITVVDAEQFGLGGSAGSTPLRLTVAGEPASQLFAKLYAQNHLRADRWYKLGRTLLYGRLEDEGSFSTVRRLVQYEDYLLRVMRDAGLPTPKPYGFVEITPEREYLLVTDFVPGAKELLDADIDEKIIDQCLVLVRRLWDSGIAHRDVKPSNLLVAAGRVHLIDVAFGEVRPSPWRQAVDLANMMLVLALRSDAETVYRRALVRFTPDEIAEAFAASHGVTIPSQTRALLKADGRNLMKRFRSLAPPRKRISIQRWSMRRIGLTFGVGVVALLIVSLAFSNVRGAGLIPPVEGTLSAYSGVTSEPGCEDSFGELMLMAQSVPSSSLLPCIESLPLGWTFGGMDVRDGRTRLFLDSDRAGFKVVDVTLTRSCDTSGAVERPSSDEVNTTVFVDQTLRQDRYLARHYYVFEGGCAVYNMDFSGQGRTQLADEARLALTFYGRDRLEEAIVEATGLRFRR